MLPLTGVYLTLWHFLVCVVVVVVVLASSIFSLFSCTHPCWKLQMLSQNKILSWGDFFFFLIKKIYLKERIYYLRKTCRFNDTANMSGCSRKQYELWIHPCVHSHTHQATLMQYTHSSMSCSLAILVNALLELSSWFGLFTAIFNFIYCSS